MGPRGHFYSSMSLTIRDKQVFRGLTGSQRTPRVWGVTEDVPGFETVLLVARDEKGCDRVCV